MTHTLIHYGDVLLAVEPTHEAAEQAAQHEIEEAELPITLADCEIETVILTHERQPGGRLVWQAEHPVPAGYELPDGAAYAYRADEASDAPR